MAVILIILLVLMFRNAVYSREHNDVSIDQLHGTYTTNNNWEDRFNSESMDGPCPSGTTETIVRCGSELASLASSGFPWKDSQYYDRNLRTVVHVHNMIKDPLDSLRHVCRVFQEFHDCISYHRIKDYCLLMPSHRHPNALYLHMTFHFICKLQTRDTVHTLQCLQDTKVLSVLEYHIGNRCVHGPGILENQMKLFKKVFFYMMDIPANFSRDNIPPALITRQCLPRKVIEGCVKDIVEQKCGNSAANLVVGFFAFQIEQAAKALSEVGLSPVDCDWGQKISPYRNNVSNAPSNRQATMMGSHYDRGDGLVNLLRMSFKNASGLTGLDTVFGKRLQMDLTLFQKKHRACNKNLLFMQYQKCLVFSNARYEEPTYSILQNAHGLLGFLTQGTVCSRLEELTACWKLQRQVCGPNVTGYEHEIILQKESCIIQDYMEGIQCKFQDTLFEVYINASQKTVWPLVSQSGQPLFLDNANYVTDEITESFEHFLDFLQKEGVPRIANRCGSQAAGKLQELYSKLGHYLGDAFKLKLQMRI